MPSRHSVIVTVRDWQSQSLGYPGIYIPSLNDVNPFRARAFAKSPKPKNGQMADGIQFRGSVTVTVLTSEIDIRNSV